MADDDVAFLPANQLVARLRRRELSSRELLALYLQRVERHNGNLNAVVTLDVERAEAAAQRADELSTRGEFLGALHGLPMTVKDCFETAGLRTTCGDVALADHVPDTDADTVARLRAAGAVVFGKTNTPTQTLDIQTKNPVFGVTNNPWDVSRIPGGSSGGSAAALAAGLAPIELGSDIGGSIRIPSHCCGVFGHKPTWGVIPERGHIPGAPGSLHHRDINCNGPMARSADDLAMAFGVLAGGDALESVGWRLSLPSPRHREVADFRIAAWIDDPFCPTESAWRTKAEAACEALRAAGAKVDDSARPAFTLEENHEIYVGLLNAAISPMNPPDAPGLSHKDWIALDERRQQIRRAWRTFFSDYDVVLAPPLFCLPFTHQPDADFVTSTIPVDGQDRRYLEVVVYSGLASNNLLPSTCVPLGPTSGGLPAGMQVIGPYLEDPTTIEFARCTEAVLGGFVRPPAYR